MTGFSSTCLMKETTPYLHAKKKRNHAGLTFICLWAIASLITSALTDTNAKLTGFTMVFRIHDAVLLLLSTFLLSHAFSYENPYMIIPWIATSGWNMYYCQYQSLFKILRSINRTKVVSKLMWFTFTIDVLTLGIKILLLARVAYLGINMWYQNKLEKEALSK